MPLRWLQSHGQDFLRLIFPPFELSGFLHMGFARKFAMMCMGVLAAGQPNARADEASLAAKSNVLLICVDDLRPELGCYGYSHVESPHIDQLARQGTRFTHHYVQSPTCGASRYALLTGRYGAGGNDALFQRARAVTRQNPDVTWSMPGWFRKQGFQTLSIGKVSHHPGGRGGADWNDPKQIEMLSPDGQSSWTQHRMPVGPWQHPRGAMHGLARGEIRTKAGEMDVYQAVAGDDALYPDGLTLDDATHTIAGLAESEQPFLLAVGIIRPHLPFGAPSRFLEMIQGRTLPAIEHPDKPNGAMTWHKSGEFMKYNRWGRDPNTDPAFAEAVRRHYVACVGYADHLIGRLMTALDDAGLRNNTHVVVWGDHGWHLGEHAVWGKHTLFEESLHSPLIITPAGESNSMEVCDDLVETVDVFPTLCHLAGIPTPNDLDGRSLAPAFDGRTLSGKNAFGYHRADLTTLRTPTHRIIWNRKSSKSELYDRRLDPDEASNVADENQALVSELVVELKARDARRQLFR